MSDTVMTTHGAVPVRLPVVRRGMAEGLLGAVAAILGIVGLALAAHNGTVSAILDAVSVIVLGIGLIMAGAALFDSYARMLAAVEGAGSARDAVSGTTLDYFLGAGIVILGILALLHLAAPVLVAVAFILIGAGFALNSAAAVRMVGLEAGEGEVQGPAQRLRTEIVLATFSVRMISGLAVIVLGILAVVGIVPSTLTMIAAIVAGAALAASVTSMPMRFARTTNMR
ncbi:MAG: hypothetical protein ACREFJ_03215 [Acetobacteraceae bacterium]